MSNNDLTLGGEPCRLIPGYEDYAVSASGKVFSLKHGKVYELKPKLHDGYPQITLSMDGITRTRNIHNLVMLCWAGACPQGYEINHINRNRSDNRLENLEYVTHQENVLHSRKLGSWEAIRGEQAPRVKLTEKQILQIRAMWNNGGYSQKELAGIFGVNFSHIWKIINRRTWKHLP